MEPQTLQNGSVWDLVLSEDRHRRYIFVADGADMQVVTIARQTGEKLGSFGRPGHMAGNFKWVHNIATFSSLTATAEAQFTPPRSATVGAIPRLYDDRCI